MSKFTLHTMDGAPEDSKEPLQDSIDSFGSLLNIFAVMAESPGILEGYQHIHRLFSNSSFDAAEQTVVWQTINVEHECHYCVPAHTFIANHMEVDPAITEALRNGTAMPSEKLQVLHETTLAMLRSRGRITKEETEKFFAAGYENRHLLDIILGLSQKVMSNYVNHIAETPVDAPFVEYAWEKSSD